MLRFFCTVLLCSAATAIPAVGQVAAAPTFEPSTEVAATSRAMVAVSGLLSQGGFEEPKIRSAANLGSRAAFRAAGASLNLLGSANPVVPRLAFGGAGSSGAAFLVRLPDVNVGVAPDDPARAPHYALATVVGTRLSVWAFFSDVPSDAVLSRRMIVAFGKLERPMMTFDTAFQPGPGIGAERYLLR